MSDIQREDNRIVFSDILALGDVHYTLSAIHHVRQAGYSDLILDFNACIRAFPTPMLAICARAMKMRGEGVDIAVILPSDEWLNRLFRNANWAHFLEPTRYAQSTFNEPRQLPATRFTDPKEQHDAVDRIAHAVLEVIHSLDRDHLTAFEWSVSEITDNVLTHSESAIGGLVQVSFQKATKRVQYVVSDAGLGIPKTLRNTHPELRSDPEALDRAVREGVTRDKEIGQGNGLFGSFEICRHSEGLFQIESGYGRLTSSKKRQFEVRHEPIPLQGTLVTAVIDLSSPHLLEDALRFGGKPHSVPTDFVEAKYESHESSDLIFVMRNEAASYGARVAGTPVRTKLLNLMHIKPGQKIIVDFSGISLISSSFADEVFGKMFVHLGAVSFSRRIDFRNVTPTVQQLLDKAIAQRIAASPK